MSNTKEQTAPASKDLNILTADRRRREDGNTETETTSEAPCRKRASG